MEVSGLTMVRLGPHGTRLKWVLVTRNEVLEPSCQAFLRVLEGLHPLAPLPGEVMSAGHKPTARVRRRQRAVDRRLRESAR
jgi:hypothetical protein